MFAGTGQSVADVFPNVVAISPAIDVTDGNENFHLQLYLSRDYDTGANRRTLVLDGTDGTGTLKVDITRLSELARLAQDPFDISTATIVVRNFDTVIFDGETRLQNLTVSDVRHLHAPDINITGKFESDRVEEIELKSIDGFDATVKGDHVKLLVGDFGSFTVVHLDLQSALI